MGEKNSTATIQTGLKEFVQRTIEEVLDGIEEARENTSDPSERDGKHVQTEVQFNVAVTTSESGESGGKFGIGVAKVIEAGLETGEQTERSATIRVQFSVPLYVKEIPSGDADPPPNSSMSGGPMVQ